MTKTTVEGSAGGREQEREKEDEEEKKQKRRITQSTRRTQSSQRREDASGAGHRRFYQGWPGGGAGGVGEIAGAKLPVFVGEEGEGVGFFGVFGDAELGGGEHFDGCQGGGKLRHDERIVGAATGDDELVNVDCGENEAVESVHDGKRGEEGDGAEEIVGMGAMFFGQAEDFLRRRERRKYSRPVDFGGGWRR